MSRSSEKPEGNESGASVGVDGANDGVLGVSVDADADAVGAEDGWEELGAVVREDNVEKQFQRRFALQDAFARLAAQCEALKERDGDAHFRHCRVDALALRFGHAVLVGQSLLRTARQPR